LFLNLLCKKRRLFSSVILLVLILAPAVAFALPKVKVKDIHYWSSPDYTRIAIELSEPVEFTKSRLSNPDRIFFDLKNASIAKEIAASLPVGDGILKSVRASQFTGETVRVVFDIEEISDLKCFLIESPSKLVIDLYGKGGQTGKAKPLTAKRRIVIDAGHGGHDPGAVGPQKLYEKDVVLDVALKVRKFLMKDPQNEVFLTRDTDVFIPLEQRTAFANRKNADLFVSIHANASPNRMAKGIETYLLNWTDDEEANKVAARENKISLRKMKALNKQFDILDVIKTDLMRENKRDESVKLANYIQKSLISNIEACNKHVQDLGVKQALFYVLFGANMPSVLAEISFISNPDEEKRLSKESYKTDIAKSIVDGINAYFKSVSPVQKVAKVNYRRPY
jgi:N-acetylmuramoyl-L-alanine amidase